MAERCARFMYGMLSAEARRCLDLGDLIGAGTAGLLVALETFDPAGGLEIDAHARLSVGRAIRESVAAMDWLPKSVRQAIGRTGVMAPSVMAMSALAGEDGDAEAALDAAIHRTGRKSRKPAL